MTNPTNRRIPINAIDLHFYAEDLVEMLIRQTTLDVLTTSELEKIAFSVEFEIKQRREK